MIGVASGSRIVIKENAKGDHGQENDRAEEGQQKQPLPLLGKAESGRPQNRAVKA